MTDTKVKLLSFNELGLDYGQPVTILTNPGASSVSFDAIFVGCSPDDSVLISAPAGAELPRMIQDQKIVVRTCLPSGVALFPTKVLHLTEAPMPIAFLDYPRDIKFKQVRGAPRVEIMMPVLASNRGDKPGMSGLAGKIIDISTTGARVEIYSKLGDVGDEVQIKGKFKVDNITRLISINAVIKAEKAGEKANIYGLQFVDGDEDNRLVLMGFIFREMAFGQQQSVR